MLTKRSPLLVNRKLTAEGPPLRVVELAEALSSGSPPETEEEMADESMLVPATEKLSALGGGKAEEPCLLWMPRFRSPMSTRR